MCATSEGMEMRNTFRPSNTLKSVTKLTSEAFIEIGVERVAHLYSKYTATAAAETESH